ncbi:unnamed protein product [Heligmosomoides polygyrus]|uniref:GMC_oxred_C domain-containing protein n=1 Tax=Heligmosomoides polygyrus TaxID=6339 RepID=A0A183F739_HELPZ|nr:unnamed protein product [Heligmosomoides polygyrus]
MLWGDRPILHDLRSAKDFGPDKDKVYLSPGAPAIEPDEVGIAFTKYIVHYCEFMRIVSVSAYSRIRSLFALRDP